MSDAELTFFTCEIDGRKHIGWFRSRGQDRLEVQTIGLLEVIALDGREPVVVARTCLEFFVRERIASGKPVPGIEDDLEAEPDPYSRAPPGCRMPASA
jgi:hypothetical protein